MKPINKTSIYVYEHVLRKKGTRGHFKSEREITCMDI